jgi:3-hydroxybutyryl-CoA dehydrogenase
MKRFTPGRALEVGVVGSGTMGAGIAQVAAVAGHPTHLYDVDAPTIERALDGITAHLARAVDKGRMDGAAADSARARIAASTDLAELAGCGLVIEAAPERLELKRELFRQLEGVVAESAILASNTSTLSIAAIAGGLDHPERVCGMHFFNPAPVMALVEVVRGPASDPELVGEIVGLARAWGKTAVEVADTPGFIVNRVARPFYGEALRLLGDGAAGVETIDAALRDAGFPMGPFQLMDLIGIDVNYAAARSVYEGFFGEPRFRPHPIQRSMVESGRLGRKSGRGYYAYAKP